jgi:hypothetical protein
MRFLKKEFLLLPNILYVSIWCIICSLYALRLIDYPPLSIEFYIAIFLNVIGILSGFWLGLFGMHWPNKEVRAANRNLFIKLSIARHKQLRMAFWACCIFSFIGIILMYLSIFNKISIAFFFSAPSMVKRDVPRSLVGTLLSTGAFIAVPIGAMLKWGLGFSLVYVVIPIALICLYSLSFFGRAPFVMGIIMLFSAKALLSLCSSRSFQRNYGLNGKRFFYIFLLPIIYCIFSWSIYFRIAEYGERYVYNPYEGYVNDSIIIFLEKFSFLFGSPGAAIMAYSYLTSSIAALNYWVSHDSEYGFGQASFPYIFRFLARLDLIQEPIITGDRIVTDLRLQLPTYLGYAYIDFGFIGVLIYGFILSFISTRIYVSFLVRPNFTNYLILPFLYVVVLLSPFIWVLQWTDATMALLGLIVISFILRSTISSKKKPEFS